MFRLFLPQTFLTTKAQNTKEGIKTCVLPVLLCGFLIFDRLLRALAVHQCPCRSILNTNADDSLRDSRYRFVPRRYLPDGDCRFATTQSVQTVRRSALLPQLRCASVPCRHQRKLLRRARVNKNLLARD